MGDTITWCSSTHLATDWCKTPYTKLIASNGLGLPAEGVDGTYFEWELQSWPQGRCCLIGTSFREFGALVTLCRVSCSIVLFSLGLPQVLLFVCFCFKKLKFSWPWPISWPSNMWASGIQTAGRFHLLDTTGYTIPCWRICRSPQHLLQGAQVSTLLCAQPAVGALHLLVHCADSSGSTSQLCLSFGT